MSGPARRGPALAIGMGTLFRAADPLLQTIAAILRQRPRCASLLHIEPQGGNHQPRRGLQEARDGHPTVQCSMPRVSSFIFAIAARCLLLALLVIDAPLITWPVGLTDR